MYAIICVSIEYDIMDDGPGPYFTAETHDWKLILDNESLDLPAAVIAHVASASLPGFYDLGGDNADNLCGPATIDH